jgi:secondary thiamine-phosphate synthase enzyme
MLKQAGGTATSTPTSAWDASGSATFPVGPQSEISPRQTPPRPLRRQGAASRSLQSAGAFQVCHEILAFQTGEAPHFVDITDQVAEVVTRSGVVSGQVVAFSRHTTAAVRVQEAEPLLLDDMKECLERLAPRGLAYRHNDFRVRTVNMTPDESPNGHAHCQHLFLGASESVPVVDGRLALGRWQRLFLIELDHPRRREIHVQVQGLALHAAHP